MKIAVLSLTRDRLDYTKHCFAKLKELAGCPYDHYVLDQGSTDGTPEWLAEQKFRHVDCQFENIGISRGLNRLLRAVKPERYDMVVKFDNDCEMVQEGTLATACYTAQTDSLMLLSPRVEGLKETPLAGSFMDVNGERVGVLHMIGGIFSACPARVYERFRYDERNPVWGMDDVQLSQTVRNMGGTVGYLMDWHVNHFETTVGQEARFPDYFVRKYAEYNA